MKYIFAILTAFIFFILLLPIFAIKWDNEGLDEVLDGVCRAYGIEDK